MLGCTLGNLKNHSGRFLFVTLSGLGVDFMRTERQLTILVWIGVIILVCIHAYSCARDSYNSRPQNCFFTSFVASARRPSMFCHSTTSVDGTTRIPPVSFQVEPNRQSCFNARMKHTHTQPTSHPTPTGMHMKANLRHGTLIHSQMNMSISIRGSYIHTSSCC